MKQKPQSKGLARKSKKTVLLSDSEEGGTVFGEDRGMVDVQKEKITETTAFG